MPANRAAPSKSLFKRLAWTTVVRYPPAIRPYGDVPFLFVPLTLGLSFMLVIMESIYVITENLAYHHAFWARLFRINFVLEVMTGLTMSSNSGMNWSIIRTMSATSSARRSRQELMAFPRRRYSSGWKCSAGCIIRQLHLLVTFLVALG